MVKRYEVKAWITVEAEGEGEGSDLIEEENDARG